MIRHDVRDGLGLNLNGSPVEIQAAGPPVIPIGTKVAEKNVSQFVAKHAKFARAVQAIMNRNPHFPLASASGQGGEATVGARKRLEVDANTMPGGVLDCIRKPTNLQQFNANS